MARLARFALLGRAVGLPLPVLPLPGLALALRIVGTAEGDAESAEAGGGANSEPPALLSLSPELGLRWAAAPPLPSGGFSRSFSPSR